MAETEIPSTSTVRRPRPPVVVAIDAKADHYAVTLDGKPLRTPGGATLQVPTLPLANAIADEIRQHDGRARLAVMPMTQLAATAQDRVAASRDAVIASLLAYVDTELCCYRADGPTPLQARQQLLWQPLLDAFALRTGVSLRVTTGIAPLHQPPQAFAALAALLQPMPAMQLAGLAAAVQVCGSLVIGLALADGTVDSDAAYNAALLDELYQAERWGFDAEAEQRRSRIAADIANAARFLQLLRPEAESTR